MARPGKEYEQAVHAFVERLMPAANVSFDHKVADRDTGSPRQVDVWIDAKIAQHFPVTINVSCKDHSRRVDITKIGTFIDEVRSTGASTGIMYSKKGFSKNALIKAKANGIACCMLYEQSPADLPESVWAWQYVCIPRIELKTPLANQGGDCIGWKDFLGLPSGDNGQTVRQNIDESFRCGQSMALEDAEKKNLQGFATPMSQDFEFFGFNNSKCAKFTIVLHYSYYRARMEAHVLNGSYCLNSGEFMGTLQGPIVDTRGPDPGPGWEQLSEPPRIDGNALIMTIKHDGLAELIERQFENLPLTESQASLAATV